MASLEVADSSFEFVRPAGTANAVQGLRADGKLEGANLLTALPFYAYLQGGDGSSELQLSIGTLIWIKVSGIWKQATPYIKIAGTWKQATTFIKVSGTWK